MKSFNVSKIKGVSIAGGRGKRLKPLTDGMPKALLPVGIERKPMLEFTLKPWVKAGIKNYVFCIGYRGEMIKDHFKDGKEFGINIEYSEEKGNLETGGALKNAMDKGKIKEDDRIIIFYCDDFVSFNPQEFIDFHRRSVEDYGFKATIIASVGFRCHYGIIEVESLGERIKKVVDFKEKPLINKHANVGIYFLEPEVLRILRKYEPPFKLERVILPEIIEKDWLAVFEISPEKWLPVNTDKEYNQALKISLNEFYPF